MKFLIINGKNKIMESASILEVLSDMVDVFDYELINEHNMIVYFNEIEAFDFLEVLLTINQDFYNDYRGFVSKEYDKKVKEEASKVLKRLADIPFDDKHIYIDDRIILKHLVSVNKIDEELKKEVLGKYYKNTEVLNTIKTYLDNNQNTTLASKKLFMHRNTLIQRIERFNEETNLDIRTFVDGYLIYHLL